jgi:GAF domain-containing protein
MHSDWNVIRAIIEGMVETMAEVDATALASAANSDHERQAEIALRLMVRHYRRKVSDLQASAVAERLKRWVDEEVFGVEERGDGDDGRTHT